MKKIEQVKRNRQKNLALSITAKTISNLNALPSPSKETKKWHNLEAGQCNVYLTLFVVTMSVQVTCLLIKLDLLDSLLKENCVCTGIWSDFF